MHTIYWILFALSLMVGVLWLATKLWKRLNPLEYKPDEEHTVLTQDGWSLPLFRWRAKAAPQSASLPVILCHGLGVNHLNVDLSPDLSLARYLASQGFDCWVASLRSGCHPNLHPPQGTARQDFSFDMLVEHDVTAIIHHVLEQAQAQQVHWIGHSMGGLIGMLGEHEKSFATSPIRSLCALASPSLFLKKDFPEYPLDFLLKRIPTIPVRWLVQPFAPISHWFGWAVKKIVRVEYCAKPVLEKVTLHMLADLSPRLVYQFSQMVRSEALCNETGEPVYEQQLRNKNFPAFFLTGSQDGVAPPHSARYAHDQWAGPKRWHLFHPETGSLPYGHGDILIGERAPLEVYPVLLAWLQEHSQNT